MRVFRSLLILGLCMLAMPALAVKNPISVHVLSLQDGLPAPGVEVTLERRQQNAWVVLNRGNTAPNGRIEALYPADKPLEKGTYRVLFMTGPWFAKHGKATFFPQVPVVFTVDGSLPHYHIPLLLSPYGYSVYRGN